MEYKILIVDDDPTMLFLHSSLIVKSGISAEPVTFLNGQEAYEYLVANNAPDFAYLVLLDLNMPVMNGWEFLERVKDTELLSQLDIVIVTSSIDKADRQKAKHFEKVVAYITKPFFNLDEVRKIVNRYSATLEP